MSIRRVREIVAAELDIDAGSISDNSSSDNTKGWDSIAQIGICLALQAEFGKEFSTEEIAESMSISALCRIIDRGTPS